MKKIVIFKWILVLIPVLTILSCNIPSITLKNENKTTPQFYKNSIDSSNLVAIDWREFFDDDNLTALIDTALENYQELNIMLLEVNILQNETRAKKGEYLPTLNFGLNAGLEKEGRFTRHGAVDEQLEIEPGRPFPEPLPDFKYGVFSTWEIDIWRKLRNSKDAAVARYLASIEGRNFAITNLISEISISYYELMAIDNMLDFINSNIDIQTDALKNIKIQKESAKVTQLAVNRFEAQLLNTINLKYKLQQNLVQTENHLNVLTGRFPIPISRNSNDFMNISMDSISAGLPSQLLNNRPDIKQAELELAANKLEVKVARAYFYPSVELKAGIGFQAFNPKFLINPYSLLFNLAGDLVAPLLNRNAIEANYLNSNAKQIQAVYNYERAILNAYVDVLNQLSNIDNLSQSFATKQDEVKILINSISIANSLFNSARADYNEVLLTQREALEAKMELIEIQLEQLQARVNVYRALGGGWN